MKISADAFIYTTIVLSFVSALAPRVAWKRGALGALILVALFALLALARGWVA